MITSKKRHQLYNVTNFLSKYNLIQDRVLMCSNYLEINNKDLKDFHENFLLLMMMVVLNLFVRCYVLDSVMVLLIENESVVDDDEHENDFLFGIDL